MTKEQIKTNMQRCASLMSDIATSVSEDTFDSEIDIDTLLVGIDEIRHMLDRLEVYSEQYENAED